MRLSERMMVERYELGSAREDSALRAKGAGAVGSFTLLLTAMATVLMVGAINVFEGWAHAIVIGSLLFTTFGLAVAISPNRRG